jgi:large subunit ribosomal protein L17
MARLGSKDAVQKLFGTEFRTRFESRPGGYTRIFKMSHRLGDAADMALIEFVDYTLPEPKAEDAE